MNAPDVVVVGAGIVGAATASELARRGLRVLVLEAGPLAGGATAEGMGHFLFLDEPAEQFELVARSQALWAALLPVLPPGCEVDRCGTLWVAADEEEWSMAEAKAAGYRARGVAAEAVPGRELRRLEPELSASYVGALRILEDGVVYPPRIVHYLLREAPEARRVEVRGYAPVAEVRPASDGTGGAASVRLADGRTVEAGHVVVATGVGTARLLPELEIRPRKGHLAITERAERFVHHHVVELGYVKKTPSR